MSEQTAKPDPLGATVTGFITEKTEGGMFVKVDDELLGLLRVDEMKGANPQEWEARALALNVGDEVLVKIIEIGRGWQLGGLKVLLSEQEAFLDQLAAQLNGTTVICRVADKTPHGVFVNLGNGLEGMVHVSELNGTSPEQREARLEALEEGDAMTVRVISVAPTKTGDGPHIGLSEAVASREGISSKMLGAPTQHGANVEVQN
jgi:small subunit ribosomal protein S1